MHAGIAGSTPKMQVEWKETSEPRDLDTPSAKGRRAESRTATPL